MTIIKADARNLPFDDGRFSAIVTSPPYFGMRSYGDDNREIGKESLTGYFSDMQKCAEEWRRVTSDNGVLWLNIADTASGSGGAGGDYNRGGSKEGKPKWKQGSVDRPPMNWLNIPHRVADLFVEAGWLYRSCVVWDKGRMRPEDLAHSRRPGISHEFVFLFSKNRNYKFYADRLPEKGSVWHFPPSRGRQHLAPYPLELPFRCILASTDEGDEVLDPFVGSGTTIEAAHSLRRSAVGCDLYDWSLPSG